MKIPRPKGQPVRLRAADALEAIAGDLDKGGWPEDGAILTAVAENWRECIVDHPNDDGYFVQAAFLSLPIGETTADFIAQQRRRRSRRKAA